MYIYRAVANNVMLYHIHMELKFIKYFILEINI